MVCNFFKCIHIFVFVYQFFSNIQFSSEQNKCRILALEGGGDRGAYQAGVISGIVNNIPWEESSYDVVTGISIGSINAGLLSLYERGDELRASKDLINHWRNISSYNVYQNWPYLGPLYGLLFKSGVLDTSVGLQFLNKTFSFYNGTKRDIIIGATNIVTGEYTTFDNSNLNSSENMALGLLSSAAVPFFFPLITFMNNTFMDGGVLQNVDIFSGVHKCEEKGFNQKDIVVDVILCFNLTLAKESPDELSPLGSFARFVTIHEYESVMGMLEEVRRYSNVTLRYVVGPHKYLPTSLIPLYFLPEDIEKMIEYGKEDAKIVISQGPGYIYKILDHREEIKKLKYSSIYSKQIEKTLGEKKKFLNDK